MHESSPIYQRIQCNLIPRLFFLEVIASGPQIFPPLPPESVKVSIQDDVTQYPGDVPSTFWIVDELGPMFGWFK